MLELLIMVALLRDKTLTPRPKKGETFTDEPMDIALNRLLKVDMFREKIHYFLDKDILPEDILYYLVKGGQFTKLPNKWVQQKFIQAYPTAINEMMPDIYKEISKFFNGYEDMTNKDSL